MCGNTTLYWLIRCFCIGILLFPYRNSYGQRTQNGDFSPDTAGIYQLQLTAANVETDSAIILYKIILQKSIKANYSRGAAVSLMNIGQKYIDIGRFNDGLNYFRQAFHWCLKSGNEEDIASYYSCLGLAYFYLGDYVQATDNYYTALWKLKKINKTISLTAANSYSNLAIINWRLNQGFQALGYFNEAEYIARKGNFDYQLAMVLINKGEYYLGQKKTDSARNFFKEGLDIAKRINKIDLQANANEDIGETFVVSSQYEKAVPYLLLAIDLSKNKYNYIRINASYNLGEAWYHLGKYHDAEEILVATLKEARTSNLKDNTIKGYATLAELYRATGQYKKAFDYIQSMASLKDTLTSIEKATAINQMEIKFQTAEKEKLIEQNKLLIVEQKSKLTQKNLWIIAIGGSIVFLVLILLGIYRNSRHKQSLQAEHIKSLQQENRIGVLKAIVQGEENERSRIARELHDGIGGMLSAAMMRFMTIRHENKEITRNPAYHEVMDLLGEMGDEIRKTAHNLMPEVLMKQSLPDAVRSFCNYVQQDGGLQIDFQCYGAFENISQEFKLNIYRILQELIKNITQHARADNALVQMQIHEQLLTITVEDDGIGFNSGEVKNGLGLHNLQTRILSLDGHYTFESEAGKGTSVYIEFDLRNVTSNEMV
jgi:signal transduction histidine kinase